MHEYPDGWDIPDGAANAESPPIAFTEKWQAGSGNVLGDEGRS
jgi:hypothetical protein